MWAVVLVAKVGAVLLLMTLGVMTGLLTGGFPWTYHELVVVGLLVYILQEVRRDQ